MKPKHQRLALALAAVVALLGAALLALSALRDDASYFYTPADVAAGKAPIGRAMRLGGMVARGSLTHGPDGAIRFVVEDRAARVVVLFRGIVPDLFREGSGVVAEGRLIAPTQFAADNLLAKHDETYRPRAMGAMTVADEHRAAASLVQ